MITMNNVLKRGRTVWDRSLLSEDEYVERVRALREVMAERGLDAVVSIGHSAHTGNFTYLSGYVPPLGWMSVVLGAEAGPVLVSGGGSREIPFVRTQTWIEDIRTSPSLFTGPAEVVAETIAELASPGARVGVVGALEDLAAAARTELLAALGAYEVVEVDDLLTGLRAVKRPREQLVLARAHAVAEGAVADAVAAWEDGASNTAALIAAERGVRIRGARDARILGTQAGEVLEPVEEHSEHRGERLVVFCAVEYLGYWAQACGTAGDAQEGPAARRAVDAMMGAARPGAPASALAAAAIAELPAGSDDVALAYGLGGGLGIDLPEFPRLAEDSADIVPAGSVLALQAFTLEDGRLTCAGDTVRVEAGGVTRL
jgi:Xaa-Pro aminopeptidase